MRKAYDRTSVNGHTLNMRTFRMYTEACRLLGRQIPILQGSYNTTVGASSGTHAGGGAIDVPHELKGLSTKKMLRAYRRVGFAAWFRRELWATNSSGQRYRVWPNHIHMIALGDKQASPEAKVQMRAYLDGYDGLADGHGTGRGGPDDGPRKSRFGRNIVQTWAQYKAKHPKRFGPTKKGTS